MALPLLGIFDSGVGGLTVVRELLRQLPGVPFVYFGDTLHLPYGSRSPAELYKFADEISAFLLSQGVDLIIDACNSTSAVALPHLKKKYPLPFVGVIEPGVKMTLAKTQGGRVGVIATEATVKSRAHECLFRRLAPGIRVFPRACPLFVPLVEAGLANSPLAFEVAQKYLQPLKEKGIDTLLLGCTHYPYLTEVLAQVLGKEVLLVDPAVEVIREVKKILENQGTPGHKERGNGEAKENLFYVSGDPESFRAKASRLLGFPLTRVTRETLGEDRDFSLRPNLDYVDLGAGTKNNAAQRES